MTKKQIQRLVTILFAVAVVLSMVSFLIPRPASNACVVLSLVAFVVLVVLSIRMQKMKDDE